MRSADSRNFKYKLIKLAKTTSTNTYAFKWAKQNKPEVIICIYSNNQTHGRGQGKNKWESLKGLNITASVVLRPDFILPKQQFLISMIISLAIKQMLEEYAGESRVKIKWPNDIYVDNEKIAGILIQNSIVGNEIEFSVCGMGINVNQTIFSADAPNAVSLKSLSGKDYNCEILLEQVLRNIYHLLEQAGGGMWEGIADAYHKNLYRRFQDAPYLYRSERITAAIQGVDEYGQLMLLYNKERILCSMDEIKFIL